MSSQPLLMRHLLGQQNVFPVAAWVSRFSHAEPPKRAVREAVIGGLRWSEQEVAEPGPPPTEPQERFVQGMAFFQNQNQVVVNEFGVFVPRGIFGTNVEIRHQLGRMADGSVSLLVYGPRRERQRRQAPRLDYRAEQLWLERYRAEFAGEWVALEGGRLLSHGADARTVYEAAVNLGVAAPLLMKIEPADELPFGGW